MKDQILSKSDYLDNSKSLQTLQLIKLSLLIFSIGLCVVGKQKATWPIITWALYSEYSPRFRPPEPLVSVVELRVYTATGDLHIIKPEHILTVPRDSLSHKIVKQAFNATDGRLRDASRNYLMHALTNLIGADSDIKTIQAWTFSYPVEPLAVPPIQLQAPASEVMLGSFSTEELAESN